MKRARVFFFSALTAFFPHLLSLPAFAQEADGGIVQNLLSSIGLLEKHRSPIVYKNRPNLIVPKNIKTLPQPQGPELSEASSNDIEKEEAPETPLRETNEIWRVANSDSDLPGPYPPRATAPRSALPIERVDPKVLDALSELQQQDAPSSSPPERMYLIDPPKDVMTSYINVPLPEKSFVGPSRVAPDERITVPLL